MSESHVAPIFAALLDHPNGITAKELATLLHWTAASTSMRLGRMFFAGDLRRRCGEGPARMNNEYVYTISPVQPVKPPARGQWRPSTLRIAEHPRAKEIAALAQAADALSEHEERLLERMER